MQLQLMKPPPENVQELYLESLEAIGIDLRHHDIKFEEDKLGSSDADAWGVGWQGMLNGTEITQFTYFHCSRGRGPVSGPRGTHLWPRAHCTVPAGDLDSIYDIVWARDPQNGAPEISDVRLADELQFSVYNFEAANIEKAWKHFELCESECKALIEQEYADLARTSPRERRS